MNVLSTGVCASFALGLQSSPLILSRAPSADWLAQCFLFEDWVSPKDRSLGELPSFPSPQRSLPPKDKDIPLKTVPGTPDLWFLVLSGSPQGLLLVELVCCGRAVPSDTQNNGRLGEGKPRPQGTLLALFLFGSEPPGQSKYCARSGRCS